VARGAAVVAAILTGFALAAITGLAVAKSFTLGVAKNVAVGSKHERIVVTSKGLTVYELGNTTTRNPLCTGPCLTFWPPVTVPAGTKLTKAPGVKGTLRIWHHGKIRELTLNRHPLYLFKDDHNKKGVANGDGITGPGGKVWHVLKVASSSNSANQTTTSSTPTTTTSTMTSTSSTSTTTTTTTY
jgi:predicted lipoprotein with Yx(FWY)xxD motif